VDVAPLFVFCWATAGLKRSDLADMGRSMLRPYKFAVRFALGTTIFWWERESALGLRLGLEG
jgi:hypothetical protein